MRFVHHHHQSNMQTKSRLVICMYICVVNTTWFVSLCNINMSPKYVLLLMFINCVHLYILILNMVVTFVQRFDLWIICFVNMNVMLQIILHAKSEVNLLRLNWFDSTIYSTVASWIHKKIILLSHESNQPFHKPFCLCATEKLLAFCNFYLYSDALIFEEMNSNWLKNVSFDC